MECFKQFTLIFITVIYLRFREVFTWVLTLYTVSPPFHAPAIPANTPELFPQTRHFTTLE